MSDGSGWVKIHRSMLDNPVVMKDSDHCMLWMLLLLNATHKPHDTLFGGKRITLMPGQLITGRKKLARELHVNEHKIDRMLRAFKNEQQIEQQSKPYGSLITIKNWHKYQDIEQQNEQRMSNQRATNEQRVSTKQECKNERSIYSSSYEELGDANRADRSPSPYDSTFEEIWKLTPKRNGRLDGKKPAYAAYRRSIKAGHTPEEIRDGILALAKRYERNPDEAQYIPKGSTIYQQERWADALADTGKTETEAWGDEIDQIIEEGLKWL